MDPGIVPASDDAIERAARRLRDGELVAFPTETVYGLGGDATSETAVARIFAAKGRPRFNPLIVHVPGVAEAEPFARPEGQVALTSPANSLDIKIHDIEPLPATSPHGGRDPQSEVVHLVEKIDRAPDLVAQALGQRPDHTGLFEVLAAVRGVADQERTSVVRSIVDTIERLHQRVPQPLRGQLGPRSRRAVRPSRRSSARSR